MINEKFEISVAESANGKNEAIIVKIIIKTDEIIVAILANQNHEIRVAELFNEADEKIIAEVINANWISDRWTNEIWFYCVITMIEKFNWCDLILKNVELYKIKCSDNPQALRSLKSVIASNSNGALALSGPYHLE